ncbi:aspartyl/glutamyl-tRNA amidotransferase subunit A [Leptolyngbya valderiana BDU 20041]|nr:aspartyl/glutamyl-tRNA amidotransferase subunit A [Leptolyngbya valderiana BDU 20041]
MARPSMIETARRIARGEQSAREAAQAALTRIERAQRELNAFIQVLEGPALGQAEAIDRQRAAGEELGPLAGVPVVLKDNICCGRTTCASRMLEHYESPYDATVVTRLRHAGAVVVAKANLDEFAMGGSGEHSAFGPTRNPWDLSRVPGGSSSGSAAAVAAGCVDLALGSDTGGSVRQPAALCGLVGLKPTYGRVSRYGLVAFASSLDQIGTLTNSVEDAAATLTIIAGHDPHDATSSPRESDSFIEALDHESQSDRVAVVAPEGSVHPGVVDALQRAASILQEAGVDVDEGELPHTRHGIAAYYLIAPAEASSNLARYDGVRYGRRAELEEGEGLEALYVRSRSEGLGAEVKRRIMLGTHALSSGYYDQYYGKAQRTRRLIKNDFERLFERGARAVLMPTTPNPAFRLGEKLNDPLTMYLEDAFTVGASLAGLPAMNVPAGLVDIDGVSLPVGVQLVGRPFDEAGLLRLARTLERGLGFRAQSPLAMQLEG